MRCSLTVALIASALLCAALRGDAPAGTLLQDAFDANAKVPQRRAERGPWQIADGVARCTQDDELYKQFKDHGPIIFYDLNYTDATIRFRYQPEGCTSFVFTANGAEGHVFRFITSAAGTSLRGFPPGAEKSVQLHRDPKLVLKAGEWTDVVVTLRGDKAVVQIGDAAPIEVQHASLSRPKTNLSVGFAFGTFGVSGLSVTP